MVDASKEIRLGGFTTILQDILDEWGYPADRLEMGGNPIAICEASMVLLGMVAFAEQMKGRQVLWFVDNTVALHSFVKGSSRCPFVSRTVSLFHFMAFRMNTQVWFEYVRSEANWADGISRELGECQWARSHGFVCKEYHLHRQWWQGSLADKWNDLPV